MPEIVEERSVEAKGRGRADYSRDVQVSSIPQIRSYQKVAKHIEEFSIPANDSTEFSAQFDYAHFIFNMFISVDANVLISVDIDSEGVGLLDETGYGKLVMPINASYPVDQITVEVTNHSNIDVSGIYTHIGIKGLEDIEPVILAPPR